MKKGDFAIVDNSGFVCTGLKNEGKALKTIKDLQKDKSYIPQGRLTVVRVVGSFDNFITGNSEYLGADGLPKPD